MEHRSSTPMKKAATGTANLLLKIDEGKWPIVLETVPDLYNQIFSFYV